MREWLANGVIGDPYILNADFGFRSVKSSESLEGRLFRPDLAGGALLDAGVYPIAMAYMVFGAPSKISGHMYIGETGVDEQTGILLGYDKGQVAHISCALRTSTPQEARIMGAKGTINIPGFWKATSATLKVAGKPLEQIEMPFKGNGYENEAIEVMKCLREGKLESDIMPLDESLSIIETMDTVRAQCGLEYPTFASGLAEVKEETLSKEELLRTRAWEVSESPAELGYKVVHGWPQIPADMPLGSVSGVAVDSRNRSYVFHRGREAPWLLCFDREGKLLFTREEPAIGRAHMVAVDADDYVWLSDDGNHIIFKMSEDGEVLQVVGERGVAGNDEYHFDRQTDLAFGPNGEIYVCDGDGEGGNRRVVKFDNEGKFLLQWGREGIGPGEFAPPHAITVDDAGTVFVSDRNNWRVQVFDADGKLEVVWSHLGRIYDVAPDGKGDYFVVDGKVGRITKIDRQGNIIGFFGTAGSEEGELSTAHGIAFCPDDDIVIGHLDGRVQRFSKK